MSFNKPHRADNVQRYLLNFCHHNKDAKVYVIDIFNKGITYSVGVNRWDFLNFRRVHYFPFKYIDGGNILMRNEYWFKDSDHAHIKLKELL